jgi:hypothetical protein
MKIRSDILELLHVNRETSRDRVKLIGKFMQLIVMNMPKKNKTAYSQCYPGIIIETAEGLITYID